MTNVIFRNQTAQVVRKLKPQDFDTSATPERRILSSVTHLSQPVCQLGANFFFTKYLLDLNTPFCDYHTWLIQLYSAHRPEGLFETAIEAIGLMGISNTSYAPELEYKAQERYSMAIAALKGVLNDPVQATLDTTLLAITLLILFEVMQPGLTLNQ